MLPLLHLSIDVAARKTLTLSRMEILHKQQRTRRTDGRAFQRRLSEGCRSGDNGSGGGGGQYVSLLGEEEGRKISCHLKFVIPRGVAMCAACVA